MKSLKINTVLNMIKTCANIIFPLITFPYVSRILMAENIGKVDFANSYVSYFSLIASLGISTYAIRECSKAKLEKTNLEKTASQIYSINMCTTVFSYVLLVISILLFDKLEPYRLLIFIQSTTILFTTLGADWLNTAMEDFLYITIRSISFQIISLALLFVFVKNQNDYINYAIITVVSSSGANIVNIIYRRRYCKTRFTLDIPWASHMRPILFLFVMILSQTIFNSADITMLGLLKGDYSVGIYSTAAKIEKIVSQVVSSIVFVLIPRLSLLFELESYGEINKLLRKVLAVVLSIGIPCWMGGTILSKEIILIIGGKNFLEATLVLQILMLSFLFSLVGGSFLGNMVLLPSGNEKKYMIICCIATAVNIITNLIFIPLFGPYAAAGTTAFSSLIILLLLLLTIDKRIKIVNMCKLFVTPFVGSILMMMFCVVIKVCLSNLYVRTVICVVGGAVIYGLTQIIMKNEIVLEIFCNLLEKWKRNR